MKWLIKRRARLILSVICKTYMQQHIANILPTKVAGVTIAIAALLLPAVLFRPDALTQIGLPDTWLPMLPYRALLSLSIFAISLLVIVLSLLHHIHGLNAKIATDILRNHTVDDTTGHILANGHRYCPKCFYSQPSRTVQLYGDSHICSVCPAPRRTFTLQEMSSRTNRSK